MRIYSLLIPVVVLETEYPFKFYSAATIVRHNDDLAVFDTGFPAGEELRKGLNGFGLDPDSFTWVFNTHIHIDHFGGNHIFRNAKKVVSRRDYLFQKRWSEALLKTRNKLSYIERSFPHLPKRDVEKLIDFLLVVQKSHFRECYLGDPDSLLWAEDHPPVPDWVRIFNTPGHTPYHLSFLVQRNSGRAIITGDRVPNRDYFFEEGKGFIEVDMDRRMAKASELRIRRYAGGCGKSIIYPSHDRPFFFRTGRYVQKNPYEIL
jgi:glyoxylase-like metal-dependent hydrolase (beta-lactamase superfamily II)